MVDIKDVPRDPALPWLDVAADAEAMQERFAPHFGDRVQLLQVKVGRFTYKPGRSARFAYRLKLLDLEREVKITHVVHGRMEPEEAIAREHRKMAKQAWTQPRYGPPLVFLADIGMLLWGFPNDPKLPGLEHVARPEALLAIARRLPALQALDPVGCESTTVKYVPGKRLVMRHRLRTDAGRHVLVYGKTYGHDRGSSIHAVMRRLWETAQGDADAFVCPEPLAWLPEQRTLLLRALPGTAAIHALHDGTLEATMAKAGRGLARIHTSGVQGLEPWGTSDEFENFLKSARSLCRYDPEFEPVMASLGALGEAARGGLEPLAPVPIHAAFRFTQLLAYRDRLALVDFDGFRQGHPMCDVGSFTAHLFYLLAKRELDAAAAQAAVRTFLGAYRAAAPWGTPERALRWYTGILLVSKHAQKCVKRLKDDGGAKIRHMLDLAAELLDGRLDLR